MTNGPLVVAPLAPPASMHQPAIWRPLSTVMSLLDTQEPLTTNTMVRSWALSQVTPLLVIQHAPLVWSQKNWPAVACTVGIPMNDTYPAVAPAVPTHPVTLLIC